MGREAVPIVRTAPASEHPCEMYLDHGSARPAFTQGHHRFPVYLQNRLYGRIIYGDLIWLCGTCHDNLHGWLYWIMRERRLEPVGVPPRAQRAALEVYLWYEKERANAS